MTAAARARPGGRTSAVALRSLAEGDVDRAIFAATRAAACPSTQALLAVVRDAAGAASRT